MNLTEKEVQKAAHISPKGVRALLLMKEQIKIHQQMTDLLVEQYVKSKNGK